MDGQSVLPVVLQCNLWINSSPVSYTHLDVYKRQLLERARQILEEILKLKGVRKAYYLSLIHI